MKSYENCPVCQRCLIHSKRICRKCTIARGQILSFVESVCNQCNNSDAVLGLSKINHDLPNHIFFQVSSLYGNLLFEKVYFPPKCIEVEVNYVLSLSKLIYLPTNALSDRHFTEVVLNGYLIKLDYPLLEKTQKRIKTLAAFV
jgi:hypothetical protein